jgi:hypothetical protein
MNVLDVNNDSVKYKQIPISYKIISPELCELADQMKLTKDDYMKGYDCSNPEELLHKFWKDLCNLHQLHVESLQLHPDLPKLTDDEQRLYDASEVCPKCGIIYGAHRDPAQCPRTLDLPLNLRSHPLQRPLLPLRPTINEVDEGTVTWCSRVNDGQRSAVNAGQRCS